MNGYTKTFFALLTGWLLLAAGAAQNGTNYTSTAQSRIWVDGTSTLHNWTCEFDQVHADVAAADGFTDLSKAVVAVKASALACKNGTMDKKALSALKAGKHPTIRYTVTDSEVAAIGDHVRIRTTGRLELAGKTNTVTVVVSGKPAADGTIRFMGSLPIKMSDFGINPPTAMLGTVRTGDDVMVRFDIVVKPTK